MKEGDCMKEQIYTIPVNEAFETACECPLCHLQDRLEKEAIDSSLGAAMMEPDRRTESNEKGYCNKHFSMLFAYPNKLSLALVLDTHLEEIRKKLARQEKSASALSKGKSGLFKKSDATAFSEAVSQTLHEIEHGCVICEKIDYTMERYLDVLFFLWENDAAFRKKFDASKGVCLPHFAALCRMSVKHLKQDKAAQFLSELYQKQQTELARIQDDIHRFVLKFDYRNQDMEWGTAKDAPIRTIEKISGFIQKPEEK